MKNEIKTTITSLKSNDEICIKIVVTSNACANLIVWLLITDKACIIDLISTDVWKHSYKKKQETKNILIISIYITFWCKRLTQQGYKWCDMGYINGDNYYIHVYDATKARALYQKCNNHDWITNCIKIEKSHGVWNHVLQFLFFFLKLFFFNVNWPTLLKYISSAKIVITSMR